MARKKNGQPQNVDAPCDPVAVFNVKAFDENWEERFSFDRIQLPQVLKLVQDWDGARTLRLRGTTHKEFADLWTASEIVVTFAGMKGGAS